jgi:hypothetical protein
VREHAGFVAISRAGANPGRVGRLVLASTAPRFTGAIREARMARVAEHQGRPYFEDAVAALREQQAGSYTTDEELIALYERAGRVMAAPDEDIEVIG